MYYANPPWLPLCPQTKLGAPMLQLNPGESSVTFEDVIFQYVEGRTILNKLSFTVPSGKKIAIVGGSGSG